MKEITVITESGRPGILADISQCLADAGVNIECIEAVDNDNKGIIVLSATPYDTALQALTAAGFQAVSQQALVLRLDDQPGALARLTLRLKEAGINVRGLHFLRREHGAALVALNADDNVAAASLLSDCLVNGSANE